GDSILMTSAPTMASRRPAYAPASPVVNSNTVRPSNAGTVATASTLREGARVEHGPRGRPAPAGMGNRRATGAQCGAPRTEQRTLDNRGAAMIPEPDPQNVWRLETPGNDGWTRSARPDAVDKYYMASADGHVQEPGDVWTSRMDAKYHERLPGISIDA